MEAIGILLLGLLVVAGVVCIALSYQLSKSRPCAVCGREFKPNKQEVVAEAIDGSFRVKCDECEWAAAPTKK